MILLIILVSLLIRFLPLDFPSFTADEARVAFRGYTLATEGKDELGRPFPILFNSLTDYQLPVVSYGTALGVMFFGKSDFGARIPFILIGVGLVFLVYKIAQIFSPKKEFWILCALITAFSPGLIFLSKIPNESILLAFSFTLLFYLLTRNEQVLSSFAQNKINLIFVLAVVLLGLLTSKIAWFVTAPFVLLTLIFFQTNLSRRFKINVSILCLLLSLIAPGIFLQVPQSQRSLSENNFPIFSDITIKNGINKTRGQGIESGWPIIFGRILINKAHFAVTGFLHWLSNIQPSVYFGQFDKSASLSFLSMGAFPKVTIIPFLLGIGFLIIKKKSKLLLYPLIVTLPTALIYPKFSPEIVILSLPFIAFIIAFGFLYLKKTFTSIVIILMLSELLINLLFLSPQNKLANDLRPSWLEPILKDAFRLSNSDQVLISDDITEDLNPFILWYTNLNPQGAFLNIPYPYRFRQTNLGKIKLVGASDNLRSCGAGENMRFFSSARDLERMKNFNKAKIASSYLNSKGEVAAYFVESRVCIN